MKGWIGVGLFVIVIGLAIALVIVGTESNKELDKLKEEHKKECDNEKAAIKDECSKNKKLVEADFEEKINLCKANVASKQKQLLEVEQHLKQQVDLKQSQVQQIEQQLKQESASNQQLLQLEKQLKQQIDAKQQQINLIEQQMKEQSELQKQQIAQLKHERDEQVKQIQEYSDEIAGLIENQAMNKLDVFRASFSDKTGVPIDQVLINKDMIFPMNALKSPSDLTREYIYQDNIIFIIIPTLDEFKVIRDTLYKVGPYTPAEDDLLFAYKPAGLRRYFGVMTRDYRVHVSENEQELTQRYFNSGDNSGQIIAEAALSLGYDD